jgi:hypothetical protein
MEDERIIKRFEQLKSSLSRYVRVTVNMIVNLEHDIFVVSCWAEDLKKDDIATELGSKEKISVCDQMEKEIPLLVDELSELEEFIKQYDENFMLLPLYSERITSATDRMLELLSLTRKFDLAFRGDIRFN